MKKNCKLKTYNHRMRRIDARVLSRFIIFWIAITILILTLPISCSDNQESADKSPHPANPDSFTFFDLGKDTRLTESVRDELTEKLGRDAIERRSILNLDISDRGFLKSYIPELDLLNRELNFPPRERVDHNTVKLMYRYARKKSVPFEYVELVFSEYTSMPLLFRIKFKEDEANTVNTLQEKYGKPEVVNWGNSQSMIWRKSGDFLIVSRIPDQFGNLEYQIAIYYIDNLERLIETEKKEKEARELQRAKTGEKAF